MSDRQAYLLAAAVAAGAYAAVSGPWPLAAVAVMVTVALRRPLLLVVSAALLASFLAATAAASYTPIVEARPFSGQIRLLSDPEPVGSAIRVDVAAAGHKLEIWAWSAHAARLRPRLAGETVWAGGRLEPLSDRANWSRRRGVEGRLNLDSLGSSSVGAVHYRVANGFRRTVDAGAVSLTDDQRALFTGFVYGDDRQQSEVVADDFRAAGLTHLLAVSGQNVAFVLALSAPFINRLGPRGRLLGVAAVLIVFATVTRFEPSVLRATAMAALAAVAAGLGRESSGRRLLALAVAGLLLIDPQLVRSLAFQLSVLASGGILFLSSPMAQRIPGPRPLAIAVAVTLAAQVATAPLLVTTFGGVPVASLPANLLAGPASGPIMIWGLTAGLVAGLAGGWPAAILHLPTGVLVGWVAAVARAAAILPLGELRTTHLLILGGLGLTAVILRLRAVRLGLVALGIAVCLHPLMSAALPPPLFTAIGTDSSLWRGGGAAVLVVGPDTAEATLLRELRRARARQVDIAIFTRPGKDAQELLTGIRSRAGVGVVMGPPGAPSGFEVAPDGAELLLGDLHVVFASAEGQLTAQISETSG